MIARSLTDFVIAPMEPIAFARVHEPSLGTLPAVGFNAKSAALPAGWIRDPSVSVPIATGL
jgi:hypothetical protein